MGRLRSIEREPAVLERKPLLPVGHVSSAKEAIDENSNIGTSSGIGSHQHAGDGAIDRHERQHGFAGRDNDPGHHHRFLHDNDNRNGWQQRRQQSARQRRRGAKRRRQSVWHHEHEPVAERIDDRPRGRLRHGKVKRRARSPAGAGLLLYIASRTKTPVRFPSPQPRGSL